MAQRGDPDDVKPLILTTKCPHGAPKRNCSQCKVQEIAPLGSCPVCARHFRRSSWEKGYVNAPHNREKGNPSAGKCPGAEGRA
jgi:hypothetical protein